MCVLFCSGLCACVQKTHPADPTNGPSAVTPVCCLWICSVWMRFNLVRKLWMKPDNCVGTSLPLLFQLVVMCRRIAGVFLTALIQPWRGWTGRRSPFELRLRYYCGRRWRRNVSEISFSWEADVISLRLPAVNSQLFSHAPSFPSLSGDATLCTHLSTVILWICIEGISCQTPSGSELTETLRRCQEENSWPGSPEEGNN